jgi:hypothetical protein
VKPSSDVLSTYIQSFESPSGIPYVFTRLLYHSVQITKGATGAQQITLPFSVRSLRGILVVISDPLSVLAGSDKTVYNFPCKSSFMMRGLIEAQLQIGAQGFPADRMQFYSHNAENHVAETEKLLNITNNAMITPSFKKVQLFKGSRKYGLAAGYSETTGSPLFYVDGDGFDQTDFSGNETTYMYNDTSRFVLGISTMKMDGDFASGIDTSQAGSVTLMLNFEDNMTHRARQIHIYGLADAVVTFQQAATLVRF